MTLYIEKIKAIATALDRDADDLLALAGRVSSDLTDIIQQKRWLRFLERLEI
jgi:hypothetical protein